MDDLNDFLDNLPKQNEFIKNEVDNLENEDEKEQDVVKHKKKLNIEIVGDSLLSGLSEKAMSKKCNVKIRNYGDCTSDDLARRIDAIISHGSDVIIIHIGTFDLLRDESDTMANVTNMCRTIRRKLPDTKIAVSAVIGRKDKVNIEKEVGQLNREFKLFCDDYRVDFLRHDNIEESSLGVKRLHLNKKGHSFLAVNFIKYLQKCT